MKVYKVSLHAPLNGYYLCFNADGHALGYCYLAAGSIGLDDGGYVTRVPAPALNKALPHSYILFDGVEFRYVSSTKGKNLLLAVSTVTDILFPSGVSSSLLKLSHLNDSEADFMFTCVKHPSGLYSQSEAAPPQTTLNLTEDKLNKLLEELSYFTATKKTKYCWTLGINGLTKEPECTATAATPY